MAVPEKDQIWKIVASRDSSDPREGKDSLLWWNSTSMLLRKSYWWPLQLQLPGRDLGAHLLILTLKTAGWMPLRFATFCLWGVFICRGLLSNCTRPHLCKHVLWGRCWTRAPQLSSLVDLLPGSHSSLATQDPNLPNPWWVKELARLPLLMCYWPVTTPGRLSKS